MFTTSSETQGHLVGAEKRLNGRAKKSGEEKSRKKVGAPWDSSLNRPVPKPFKILACDWAQKYFLCPIRVQLFSCYFRDFLFERVHRQTFCSPVRHFSIYLLVQERFPQSKSAIETGTMKPKKKSSNLGCL